MVSWWGTASYSKNKRIKMGDIEVMNSAYDSSGSFESRVRSIFVGHITYTGRRNNFRSKSTPIYGPVHKADLNHSYSRSHFSRLPQAFSKKNYCLSQKVNYSYCCCCCCCISSHQSVRYTWIMRWWCSNLRQGRLRT